MDTEIWQLRGKISLIFSVHSVPLQGHNLTHSCFVFACSPAGLVDNVFHAHAFTPMTEEQVYQLFRTTLETVKKDKTTPEQGKQLMVEAFRVAIRAGFSKGEGLQMWNDVVVDSMIAGQTKKQQRRTEKLIKEQRRSIQERLKKGLSWEKIVENSERMLKELESECDSPLLLAFLARTIRQVAIEETFKADDSDS